MVLVRPSTSLAIVKVPVSCRDIFTSPNPFLSHFRSGLTGSLANGGSGGGGPLPSHVGATRGVVPGGNAWLAPRASVPRLWWRGYPLRVGAAVAGTMPSCTNGGVCPSPTGGARPSLPRPTARPPLCWIYARPPLPRPAAAATTPSRDRHPPWQGRGGDALPLPRQRRRRPSPSSGTPSPTDGGGGGHHALVDCEQGLVLPLARASSGGSG